MSQAGRPPRWAAGRFFGVAALVCVVVLLVGVLWLRDDTYEVAPPEEAGEGPRAAAASLALLDLVEAVSSRDASAAAALAPPADEAAELLTAVVRNARALRVEDFSARYVDETGAVGPDGSWQAAVQMTWAFGGFDAQPARAEVVVEFVPLGDRVAVGGIGGEDAHNPPWLIEGLAVVRDEQSLVMAVDGRAAARTWAGRVQRGIPVVRRVLPRWRPRAVVVVPASGAGVDAALDAEPGTYTGVAAVTATADGTTAPTAPVRVYANPDVTSQLRDRGSQVVMSHELVHVATGAVGAVIEPWLLEGFADYVALRDVPLPDTTIASRAIGLVREEGLPEELPGPRELDPRAEDLQAAYEQAWLACEVLVAASGEDALVDLYRAVDEGAPLPRALEQETGLTVARLEDLWRQRLRELAR